MDRCSPIAKVSRLTNEDQTLALSSQDTNFPLLNATRRPPLSLLSPTSTSITKKSKVLDDSETDDDDELLYLDREDKGLAQLFLNLSKGKIIIKETSKDSITLY